MVGVALVSCSDDRATPNTTTSTAPRTAVATSEETATTVTKAEPTTSTLDGQGLTISVLVPPPGLLATLFEAQMRGIDAAVADIAAGGGVLNGRLTISRIEPRRGSTESDVVSSAVGLGARVLIGPAGSTTAARMLTELDRLDTVSCSASATMPGLTDGQQTMSLFRTAVPDDAMTWFLADHIASRRDSEDPGAAWKVVIVARSDEYGLSVGNGLAATLQARGLRPTVVGYNPSSGTFAGTAADVAAHGPDLSVLVSYDEGPNLLAALLDAGLTSSRMIGLDPFFAPGVATVANGNDLASLDGFTAIGTTGDRPFLDRMMAADPAGQLASAAQAYDCAIVLALAAEEVESKRAATISRAVQAVTAGGAPCTTYADCRVKQAAGEDIDYDGPSGKLAIDERGNATSVRFTTGRLQDGVLADISNIDVDLDDVPRHGVYEAAAFTTELEQSLRYLGFFSGPIDGLDSLDLSAALSAFQTSVGLDPTGTFDADTSMALQAGLGEYSSLLSRSIAGLQRQFAVLGYYAGPMDGVWSADLTAAIGALQSDLDVPQTGVPDAATLQAVQHRAGS